MLGNDSRVGSPCYLKTAVLGNDSRVGSPCHLKTAVLGNDSQVESPFHLKTAVLSVLGNDSRVGSPCHLKTVCLVMIARLGHHCRYHLKTAVLGNDSRAGSPQPCWVIMPAGQSNDCGGFADCFLVSFRSLGQG